MSDTKTFIEQLKIPCPTQIDPKQTILLVSPMQDMRLIISHQLSKQGFKLIKSVSNAMEALDIVREGIVKVGLIVSDMEMPLMSGVDLINEIKADPDCYGSPFVLVVNSPNKQKIMLATESGVNEILVKPFSFKDMIPKLQTAFKGYHNPRNPEKAYDLAKALFRKEKYQQATLIYEKLGEMAEQSARPYVGLAQVAEKEGDHQKALAFLEVAQNRNKHYVHTYVSRGQIYADKKDFDKAIEQFKIAIEISPLNPVRYEAAAKLLFEKGKYQESVNLLSIAIKNELSFPALHHYLSQAYYVLKDFKKAIRHIRQALQHEPENIVYMNQLGICYKEAKMHEESLKIYNAVIKKDPENKSALYNKSVLLYTMGSTTDAIKILSRLVTLAPDFEAAHKKLKEYRATLDDVS